MGIMRLNFSHATKEEVELRLTNLANAELGHEGTVKSILLDTKGPEIRTGNLAVGSDEVEGKRANLDQGAKLVLTSDEAFKDIGTTEKLYVSYPGLTTTVKPGSQVLFDDGLVCLEVVEVLSDTEVLTTVVDGGEIGDRKGVNLPGLSVDLPAMSDKDKADILYGVSLDVDFVAASFVRTPEQVQDIRAWIEHCMKETGQPEGHPPP
jgi:pyruvate kinase